MKAKFYMRGGHVIEAEVKSVSVTRGVDGDYVGYSIEWPDNSSPNLFSLSVPDIVAVTVMEDTK